MRLRLPCVLLVAAVSLLSRATGDQVVVRGLVRDSTSTIPIPGAVVIALGSAGKPLARSLSNGVGEFRVSTPRLPAQLRFVRIGHQPRTISVSALDTARVMRISMLHLPSVMDVVRVAGAEVCPGTVDRSRAFDLWDQARAGLLATIVSRESDPPTATTLLYERSLNPGDEVVHRQTALIHTILATRPFRAPASPSVLAEQGYMTEDITGAPSSRGRDRHTLG